MSKNRHCFNRTPARLIAAPLMALVAFITLTSLAAAPAEAKKPKKGETFSARVVRVVDGDSIVVQGPLPSDTTRINLAGIDAKGSLDAQQYLGTLLLDNTVTIKVVSTKGVDSSADVSLNGSDIAETMVKAGLARSIKDSTRPIRRLRGVGRIARGILRRGSDVG